MSNPNGFTVKGKWYPAKSIVTEQAMLEHIRELQADLAEARELGLHWQAEAEMYIGIAEAHGVKVVGCTE